MCTKWIEYQGAKILYQNFTNHGLLGSEKNKEEFHTMQQVILAEPPGSVRVLADFRNGQIMKELLDAMIQNSDQTRGHIKKIAALGGAGPKRIMLNMVIKMTEQPITFFDDLETAQKWLIE
jgi:hypothetical protein